MEEQQQEQSSVSKRIIVVDDDPDITLTFKSALKAENEKSNNKMHFEVNTYNDPIIALSEFKPNWYDLLLVDFNMPKMDGLEFSDKILEQDINVKVCFVTATEVNIQGLKEQRPSMSIGCFIKKPVTIEKLVR